MKIIKKIENGLSMDSFNDSLKNLPCYGVSVQAKYTKEGKLLIKGIDGLDFASEMIPNDLALNINIYSEKKLKRLDYEIISRKLTKLKKTPLIVLSSSQLARYNLNEFRVLMLERQGLLLPEIRVAANDDMSHGQIKNKDMIYSSRLKAKNDYEFYRLVSYVDANVPVLLDWQNNSNGCISEMIERTNGSDNLIVLSKKPKTTRRIINKTLV